MKIPLWLKITISIIICLLVGFLSGMVTRDAIATWYVTLNKPSFNPPNWLFAPVWTTLYTMMGLAAGLVWEEWGRGEVKKALIVFIGQLVLNSLWSILFFGLQNPGLALIEIVLLWIMIFWTIRLFISINKVAGWLLIPYLLWVSFATVLNTSIWWLN